MPIPRDIKPEVDDEILVVLTWGTSSVQKHGLSNKMYYALDTMASGFVVAPKLDMMVRTGILSEPPGKGWPPEFQKAKCHLVPTVEMYSPMNEFSRARIVILAIPERIEVESAAVQQINKSADGLVSGLNEQWAKHDGRAIFTPRVVDRTIEVVEPQLSLGSSVSEPDAFERYLNRAKAFDEMLTNSWKGDDIIQSLKNRQRYEATYGALAKRLYAY